jgi:hypothetical protein
VFWRFGVPGPRRTESAQNAPFSAIEVTMEKVVESTEHLD